MGALGWVRVWMALAACLDRCCVAGRGGRVKHCTATPFGRLLEKPRLSLSKRPLCLGCQAYAKCTTLFWVTRPRPAHRALQP